MKTFHNGLLRWSEKYGLVVLFIATNFSGTAWNAGAAILGEIAQ
jgi:hypothetical protein